MHGACAAARQHEMLTCKLPLSARWRLAVLIGVSEGQGWRFEAVERPDDYLVRMRDLDTGALEESDSKLFRTAAVAFAYADLSAAFDRYAAARTAGEDVAELECALTAQRALYEDISVR